MSSSSATGAAPLRAPLVAALAGFSRRALVTEDLAEIIHEAATVIARALGAECSAVFEFAAGDEQAILRDSVGLPPGPVRVSAVAQDVLLKGQGSRSALSAPVRLGDRVWGVLEAYHREGGSFDDLDAMVIEGIADVLAIAIGRRSVEEAYRASQLHLAAGFDSALLGTLVVGSDGRLQEVNRAFCEMLGYSAAELEGVSFLSITPSEDAGVNSVQFRGMLGLSENRVQTVKRFLHRDGHVVWTELNVASIHPPQGGPRCFFVQVQDITERRRAEAARADAERDLRASEERLRTVVSNAPVVLCALDLEGRVTLAEGRALRALGLHPPDLVGISALDVYPENSEVRSALTRMIAGEEFSTSVRIGDVTLQGSVRPLLDPHGVLCGAIGVATDVSDRCRAEAELRERIAELHQAAEERRRLLGHLVTAQEEERRRVANDLHDEALQTLAGAIMLVDLLSAQARGTADAEVLQAVDGALESTVTQLRRLIAGLRPPGVDRGRLVSAIREAARTMFGSRVAVTVTGRLGTELQGPSGAVIFRIAQEALANCRKHSDASRVEVSLAEADGGVLVRVRDDGRGFDTQDVADRPAAGHLGMLSMRERAELAGGRWSVQSHPGSGTLVEVWIPTQPEPPPRQTSA